ncbi:MAG TPA: CHAP domain-containing protein [Polyangia bacterium]|nr:CHAP domain-containing protein [Polyangia bacterium]
MSLLLPGERPPRIWGALLAAGAVLGLCALGCASPSGQTRRFTSVFQAARFEALRPVPAARDDGRAATGEEGAAFVEKALHDAGFRFGTDGSARALWGYLRASHRVVSAVEARPGDVVFFDTRGLTPTPECADHAGIVEKVDHDGRITFAEARGGRMRRSFVDPARPSVRRDDRGHILNSFLRTKTVDDPPAARYFAGQMLCGIARAEHRGHG